MLLSTLPTRPLLALAGTAAALLLTAGPADAAPQKPAKTSAAATAKKKHKHSTKSASKTKRNTKSGAAGKGAAKVPLANRADLTVRDVEAEVTDDATLQVTGTLRNLGRSVATSSDVVIAFSDDQRLSKDDEVLDDISYRVPAGAKRLIDTEFDIPDDVDPDADFYMLICADGYNVIVERSERNNCDIVEVEAGDLSVDEDDESYDEDDSYDDGDDSYDDGSDDSYDEADGDW